MAAVKKGVILAGGTGSRLYPMTQIVSKQLLPIYDKPMICYPLSILMLMDIRDILIIVKESELSLFQRFLGDGSRYGINISFAIQPEPKGLPDAFVIARDFIGDSNVTFVLGDNIFYGSGIVGFFERAIEKNRGATTFTFQVSNPAQFGVIEYGPENTILSMEEKPRQPKSKQAISGLYHFTPDVCDVAASLKPSARGETEMVDLLRHYHHAGKLDAHKAWRGLAWLDTGTPQAMMKASTYVQVIEERQGNKIACLEEIAYLKGFIDKEQLYELAKPLMKSGYGQYLIDLLDDGEV